MSHWYFHLPNMLLAVLAIACLIRLPLSFFSTNPITRLITRITEPAMKLTRVITPAGVPDPITLISCILWLTLLRVALYLTFGAYGLLPPTGAAS